MRTADIRRVPAEVRQNRPHSQAVAAVAAIAGGLTLLIRLALHSRSFDLFGNEVIYVDLGRSVINGGFPGSAGSRFSCTGRVFFTWKQAGSGWRATSIA